MSYVSWSVVYGEQPSAAKWNQLGSNDAYFDSLIGSGTAWSSYTPTWSSSGTQPVLGNGTITGRYIQVGKVVRGNVTLLANSTTTYGTGNYYFSVPVAAAQTSLWGTGGGGYTAPVGVWIGRDSGVATYVGASTMDFNDAVDKIAAQDVNGVWARSTPWTFGSGDSSRINFTYEAA